MLPDTYEKFLEEMVVNFNVDDNPTRIRNNDNPTPYIGYTWETGGVTGGSCWGGELRSRSPEDEPEFTEIDKVLEKYASDISYLKYRKLSALFKTYDYTLNEYYGNSTDYRLKYITIEDLYNFLKENT